MKPVLVLATGVLGGVCVAQAQEAVVIETVVVGNPGNAGHPQLDGTYGRVDYAYAIAKYEVTARQYAAFLNAVAATDTYGLYDARMWTHAEGCKIARSGAPGSYTYSVGLDWANRPVNFASFGDGLRLANWLHNGQPTGAQDLTTTEDGSYFLNGLQNDEELEDLVREPDATWVMPSEDEWYKAAYHKNDGVTGSYFFYPTGSDIFPKHPLIDPDPGNNATCNNGAFTIGAPYYRTEVGAHENSESPYGTFDQGGNVWEFNESIPLSGGRGIRGGAYNGPSDAAAVWSRPIEFHASDQFSDIGLRLVLLSGGTVCGDATCEGSETPVNCPADCPCASNAQCSDGLFCNGVESCSAGTCHAGVPVDCADGVSCTTDDCNEAGDACTHTPVHALCDNGLFCDGPEVCHATLGCQGGSDPCGTASCDESGAACAGPKLWMSFKDTATVPGVGNVEDEDIVAYDTITGTWALKFDGSDVGLSAFEIGGMAVQPNGDVLLSFTTAGNVPGLSGGPSGIAVDDSDIVRFSPTSLGANTSGAFTFHFDGSDVALSSSTEGIDGIALAPNGSLILTTTGSFSVGGASGAGEDLFTFAATSLGANTAGSFVVLFDGSDVGLSGSSENIDAVARTVAGHFLLSTTGNFSVTGLSGTNEDVLEFTPSQLGSTTSGTYSMFLDLSAAGISTGEDVGSLFLVE